MTTKIDTEHLEVLTSALDDLCDQAHWATNFPGGGGWPTNAQVCAIETGHALLLGLLRLPDVADILSRINEGQCDTVTHAGYGLMAGSTA